MKGEDPIEFLHHVDKDKGLFIKRYEFNWGESRTKPKKGSRGEVKEFC
jgi:hypothetical protein